MKNKFFFAIGLIFMFSVDYAKGQESEILAHWTFENIKGGSGENDDDEEEQEFEIPRALTLETGNNWFLEQVTGYRFGYVPTEGGYDLVVWLKTQVNQKAIISINEQI